MIREISADNFVQVLEHDVKITSFDQLIDWQDQATTEFPVGVEDIWDTQSITVEAANAGAYQASNGNTAETGVQLSASRSRMAVINDFGLLEDSDAWFDCAFDIAPGSGDDVLSFGLRCSGNAGIEEGYVFVLRNSATETMRVYRWKAGVETLVVASADRTAPSSDTAYVVRVQALTNEDGNVILRSNFWDATVGEPATWILDTIDVHADRIVTPGRIGFGSPDLVATQVRSAALGNRCLDMWDVTDVDFESVDGVTVVAQTLVTDVSGAIGWLEVPNPDFTGLVEGPLTLRVTDSAAVEYEFPFTYGDPVPVTAPGGGGVIIGRAPRTTTNSADAQGGRGGGGSSGQGGSKGNGGGGVVVNVPPQAGTFDVTAHVEGYDYGSDSYYTILSSAAITTGNQRVRLAVRPGGAVVANESANDALPALWRVRMEHGDATEMVYSVEYKLD